MKQCYLLLMLLISIAGYAQEQGQAPDPAENDPGHFRPARLFGKVIEGKTNKGVEAVSVQVLVKVRDSIKNTVSDSVLAGMLTKPNGDFSFANLPLPEIFSIRFTAVGFADILQEVALERKPEDGPGFEKDMGNISLGNEAESLGAVTVVAQRPALQMGIDRKVFNVDKSLTSVGGTAVDVMRNIPSVTVDAEGNVELRNSSPQIFVDGRPTILTLQQIPSEDIEKVELITNPSAKFDAASSGGIINVVLKKNKRFGLNGIASVGAGIPGLFNGNLSLNLRQGKFNFFASGNYNQSGGIAKTEATRQNKVDGVRQDYFIQHSENERKRRFTSARFGMDYFMDNRNTISFSQNFVKGRFSNYETQQQEYLNTEKTLLRSGNRTTDGAWQFNNSNTSLNYRHNFPKSGQELTADVSYNNSSGNRRSLIANYYYNPDGSAYSDPNFVRNSGISSNDQLTIQVDYENPITETSKLEMGIRSYRNNNASKLDAFSQDNGSETKLPLSSNVKYDETIYGAYTTYTNSFHGIKYQAGLRAEYSRFNGSLIDSAKHFGYELPIDLGSVFDGLFPSLYLSKNIAEGQELQVNFSRRINRANFWELNPFIDINDPLNISQGNPALRPEYTNSFEFNYDRQYSKGSFLGVLYFRNNTGDITRYSDTITAAQYQQLSNAAIDPNAIVNTYINAQYTNRMGAEFTLQQKFGNLELIPSLNLQYRKVKATVGKIRLDNQGFNWESKLTVNYKLSSKNAVLKNLNLQLRGEYESPRVIPQGKIRPQYQADFALRKEFLKNNKANISFVVNDIFNSDRFGQIYDTETFYQDSYRRWNVRNFRMTFTYRFGNHDFNLFGNKKKDATREDE